MSAGRGPLASMPSRAQRRDRGRDDAASSRPSAPLSPACGLSPATASRGCAMPKRRRRSRSTIRAGLDDQLRREARRAPARSGTWTVTGTTASASHHSIITGCGGVRPARRQRRQELGVAGMGEAGLVEHVLRDRVGDEAPRPRRRARAAPPPRSTAMVAAAVAGSGLPGSAATASPTGDAPAARGERRPRRPRASCARPAPRARGARRVRRMKSGSPRRQKGRPISSRRSQALSVISGPMPAGSPCVRARIAAPAPLPRRRGGSVIRRRSPGRCSA